MLVTAIIDAGAFPSLFRRSWPIENVVLNLSISHLSLNPHLTSASPTHKPIDVASQAAPDTQLSTVYHLALAGRTAPRLGRRCGCAVF
jgi:hypothetical protein